MVISIVRLWPYLDSLETRIISNIDEHRLVDTLCDLIGLSSQNPPGEEKRMAEYCAQRCREIGMEVQLVAAEDERPTVIATLHGTEERPVLLYHAHLDTVPFGDSSKWKFEPLAGHMEDGRIYGRGSCDAKNNIASMIHVAEALVKSEVAIRGKLVFCFPADEETEGHLGTEYVLNQGYLSDVGMVVVGEQTELQVGIAEKGAARLVVRTKGVSAHASLVAEAGINAISKMGWLLNALDEKYPAGPGQQKRGLLDVTTCNAGIIEGGTKINMVPEHCSLQLDCRFSPGRRFPKAWLKPARLWDERIWYAGNTDETVCSSLDGR